MNIRNFIQAGLIAFGFLAFMDQGQAATYYIDYSGGSDGNNGTSTSSPWQRCPGMNGFSGSYSHASGDVFVFKGGETWPNASLPLTITSGGSSGNPDIYGVDVTWFSGSSWTRPCFDAQDSLLSGSYHAPLYVNAPNVTVKGIEVKNMYVPNSTNFNGFGCGSITINTNANVTIQGCYVHDWLPAIAANQVNVGFFVDGCYGGIFFYNAPNGSAIQNRVGPGLPPIGLSGASGCGIYAASTVISNIITGCPAMVVGGGNIGYNVFSNSANSYDSMNHANAILSYGNTGATYWIYNNIMHDFGSTYQTMLIVAGQNNATGVQYNIFNNIIWNVTSPIDLDPSGLVSNSNIKFYLFNNTIVAAIAVAILSRGAPNFTLLDCENNNFIGDPSNGFIGTSAYYGNYAAVDTLTQNSNVDLSSSAASTAGYTAANLFAPPLATSPTVGAGINLTSLGLFSADINGNPRLSVGAWNAGAFETASTAPFISLTASPTTVMSGQSTTLTWTSFNVTNLTLDDFGSVALNGSTNIIPSPGTTTYVITATGTNGTRSAAVLIQMVPQPPSKLGVKSN